MTRRPHPREMLAIRPTGFARRRPKPATVLECEPAELVGLYCEPGRSPQPVKQGAWRNLRLMIGGTITITTFLAFLAACADASVTLDRKMSEIRREHCDRLPTERQRAACIQQVNDTEDAARRQLAEARRQQAIQETVDEVRVINQTGRQW
jgi:hypothetical protein